MLVTLACIFAGTLFCNNAAHADHHIDAVITIDTQLGTLDTATIDDGASTNVSVHITHMDDYPDPTHADGTFTYSWGFFAPPPHVTLPNVNQTSNTLSTNFDTAGEYPITFLCDVDFVPATGEGRWHGEAVYYDAIQDVIGGDFTTSGTKILYYYCGAPVEYDSSLPTVSAPQQPPGTTWTWKTSSALNVQENTGTSQPDGFVIGIAGSSNANVDSIQISYSLHGVTWDSTIHDGYTVLKPYSLTRLSTTNGSNPNNGDPGTTPTYYLSQIKWQVRDQLGYPLNNVPLNETFGTFTASPAHPTENWGAPTPFTYTTYSEGGLYGIFFDNYTVKQVDDVTGVAKIPPIQYTDPNNLSQDLVTSGSQSYYVGSSTFGQGCLLNSGTLSYYVDHADHQ